ncbi:class I SAM-dependent methyltransferase, partial [bacterium]|nr:class I SAM-dependent methyltransferase [bacterium]
MVDMERLLTFIESLREDVYVEKTTSLHIRITDQVIETLFKQFPSLKEKSILDIGCGQGPALRKFAAMGCPAVGISLGEEDVRICREDGFDVCLMDQSFLRFDNCSFGFLWCRHCLEHSPFPLFTLRGFHQILQEGGYLYLEMPAPDTACHHECNGNHYSVLTQSAWSSLIERSGFMILNKTSIDFKAVIGPDN